MIAEPELPPSVEASWVIALTSFSKLWTLASAHDSGLQPLHVIDPAENLILERDVVSRVGRRVADRDDIAANKVFRRNVAAKIITGFPEGTL